MTGTKNLIKQEHLMLMKKDAIVINISRGGIINEKIFISNEIGHLSGAAVDVYEKEPYSGPLKEIERCLMTYIALCQLIVEPKWRLNTEEVIRFLTGELLQREVPKEEYDIQREGL